jgi:hypothetical protein
MQVMNCSAQKFSQEMTMEEIHHRFLGENKHAVACKDHMGYTVALG